MKARSTLITSLALSLSLLAAAGCKKKDDAASTDKGTAGATAAKPDEAKPAGGKPIEMEAPALFEDYNKPGQDGMALLDKWRAGAVVTGTVTQVITEEAGNASVWLDAGNNKKLSLGFADDGKAAKDKGVKQGDKVTAQCQIGGSDGNLMMLTDCTLK